MIVLSLDPGTSNFAASVLRIGEREGKLKVRCIGSTMVPCTIKKPAEAGQEHQAFVQWIRDVSRDHGPFDLVVAERFQSRGHKGNTIESINMMLGILAYLYKDRLTLYTASTWKNSFNRALGYKEALKDVYEEHAHLNRDVPKADRHTIHELDCTLMAVYHAAKHFNLVPFENVSDTKRLDTFIKHFDSCPHL